MSKRSTGELHSTAVHREVPSVYEPDQAEGAVSRFGVSGASERIELVPALADRHVVSTPKLPFYIPANESVTIFVGHPLWLQLLAGDDRLLLSDFAIQQPHDTWFGPDTQTGKLCYASRSFCQLSLGEVDDRPLRATTAVLIKNRASSELYLERIKLPVPYLSLFADPASGGLWTEDVVLERLDDEDLAPLQVRSGPPALLPRARKTAEPRNASQANVMVRAFGSLFSSRAQFE